MSVVGPQTYVVEPAKADMQQAFKLKSGDDADSGSADGLRS